MIYALPGSTFTAILEGAISGLVGTLGVRIENSDGTNNTPRTTSGIVEVEPSSGVYSKNNLVAPNNQNTYVVLWDDGVNFASEELTVTSDLPIISVPSYDASTDTGKVRLLISDVGGQDGNSFIFSNVEIQTFLDIKNENVMRAAALGLRTLAGNSIQVMKRITFLELQTDGEAEADILRKLAESLEKEADSGVTFETSHITRDDFSPRGSFFFTP